jgi:sugar transferase (PEP-CTERM/EpsH1 system associated)
MKSLAAGRSATEALFYSHALVQTLKEWTSNTEYDAVVAYCSSMGQYLRLIPHCRESAIVDLVDVDSQKWFDYASHMVGPLRWLYRLEGRRVRQLENEVAAQSKAIAVVSDAEATLLGQSCRLASIVAIPNGVDIEYFQPTVGLGESSAATAGEKDHSCVFVGALDYRANVDGITWFCHEVWPKVCRRFPDARFTVVGRRPVSAVRRLGKYPNIELIGEVSDVRPYLQQACVVLVPLRIARGIQNKVLEALAMEKAVIASPQALQGLGAVVGQHVYAAGTADEWLKQITSLFSDRISRSQLGTAGRLYVTNRHQWEKCLQPFAELLDLTRSDKDQFVRKPACLVAQ